MSKGNKSKPPRKISIFTPVHEKRDDFLKAAYQSLNSQKMPEGWTWEWIILQNNGGGTLDARDKRIRSFDIGSCPDWIGFIKGEAVKRCTGELLLELDSDDQLLPGCLNEVIEAFADPEIGFVYSNSVHLWIDPLSGARGKVQRFEEGMDGNIARLILKVSNWMSILALLRRLKPSAESGSRQIIFVQFAGLPMTRLAATIRKSGRSTMAT